RHPSHGEVRATAVGSGDARAWIFEPAEPTPAEAPVVVFLHGWGAWWPELYRGWIDHIVRRGRVVVFPTYQAGAFTSLERVTANARAGVRNAMAELGKDGRVRPDTSKVAVVGHSLGGVIAANIAGDPAGSGLPHPRAVMCVEPGDPDRADVIARHVVELPSILDDLSGIPEGTLVLLVVGDEDTVVGDDTARLIWKRIRHLPSRDRCFVEVVSDRRGSPALVADHWFPASPRDGTILKWSGVVRTDALDYYGTWRLFDRLTDAAFRGENRAYAPGGGAGQRGMGTWSDGTPVKQLRIRKDP
ncbi:MAG: alpha/beta hydrolase, partial [Planctomycetota bacterium]